MVYLQYDSRPRDFGVLRGDLLRVSFCTEVVRVNSRSLEYVGPRKGRGIEVVIVRP